MVKTAVLVREFRFVGIVFMMALLLGKLLCQMLITVE